MKQIYFNAKSIGKFALLLVMLAVAQNSWGNTFWRNLYVQAETSGTGNGIYLDVKDGPVTDVDSDGKSICYYSDSSTEASTIFNLKATFQVGAMEAYKCKAKALPSDGTYLKGYIVNKKSLKKSLEEGESYSNFENIDNSIEYILLDVNDNNQTNQYDNSTDNKTADTRESAHKKNDLNTNPDVYIYADFGDILVKTGFYKDYEEARGSVTRELTTPNIPGTQVTLTATPNDNFQFIGWSTSQNGDIISTENPITVDMAEITYYAKFIQIITEDEFSQMLANTETTYLDLSDKAIEGKTTVGEEFKVLTKLETLKLPYNITTINSFAFNRMTNLKTVVINDGVTTLNHNLFDGCTNLSSVYIPSTVTTMTDGFTDIFKDCSNLKTIGPADDGQTYNITYAFKNIPEKAFNNTNNAYTSIVIGKSVENIGENAFKNSNATEYTFKSIPVFNGTNIFENCGTPTYKLSLTDGDHPYITTTVDEDNNIPNAPTFSSATINRKLTTTWGSIVLPFVPSSDDLKNFKFYTLDTESNQGNGNLVFKQVENNNIAAGTPYLYKNASSTVSTSLSSEKNTTVSLSVSETAADTESSNWQMLSAFQKKEITDETYYVLTGGEIKNTSKTLTVYPMRAYFYNGTDDSSDSSAKSFTIVEADGSETSISAAEIDGLEEANEYYDIAGRRVLNPTKGLYIVNGKKVIIK